MRHFPIVEPDDGMSTESFEQAEIYGLEASTISDVMRRGEMADDKAVDQSPSTNFA